MLPKAFKKTVRSLQASSGSSALMGLTDKGLTLVCAPCTTSFANSRHWTHAQHCLHKPAHRTSSSRHLPDASQLPQLPPAAGYGPSIRAPSRISLKSNGMSTHQQA